MPRLRNITRSTITVANLAIAPGRVGEVDDAAHIAWLNRSAANRRTASVALRVLPTKGNPLEALMRDCKRHPERHQMTAAGRPSCSYLTRTLGRVVGAEERDRAWAQVQAEKAAGEG